MRVYAVQSAARTDSSSIRNGALQEATLTRNPLSVAFARELLIRLSGRSIVDEWLANCGASGYMPTQYHLVRYPALFANFSQRTPAPFGCLSSPSNIQAS
jgi:hypothetical protein